MLNKFSALISKTLLGIALAVTITVTIVTADTPSESSGVVVMTRQGLIEGLTLGKVEQFRAVPYAAPPLGDLPLAGCAAP